MTSGDVLVNTPYGEVAVEWDDGYRVVSLLAEVLARLELEPTGLGGYALVTEDGRPLSRWATLTGAGVELPAVLYLDVNPGGNI